MITQAGTNGRRLRDISVCEVPCPCGKNHYALQIGQELYCPVRFYLWSCRGAYEFIDKEAMGRWMADHPLENYLSRFNPRLDATYEEEAE